MARQASIKDVAALAGVSMQSVTRVAHGASSVSPQMREKVLAAMRQLDYQPNYAARALRAGRTRMIGLGVDHLENTGSFAMMRHVVDAATRRGYGVSLVPFDPHERREASPLIAGMSVDGLILTAYAVSAGRFDRIFPATPAVTIGEVDGLGLDWPSVDINQYEISRLAVEHLLELGHRTVYHVAGPADDDGAVQRAEGWRMALEAHGRPVPRFVHAGWWAADGYRVGLEFAEDPECTAIYAVNDTVALGVMEAMRECGRRVPEDVSIVGVDDSVTGYLAHDVLTTVRQPYPEVSEALVDLLIHRIRREPVADEHLSFSSHLIVRSSTAAPAGV